MQGLKKYIPTQQKAHYINSLIKVGFPIIDFGSFVSPKSIPQMRDTSKVVQMLNVRNDTALLSIVLNKRGALEASNFEEIKFLGYPLSVSEIFQKNNSNKDIKSSLVVVEDIQNICIQKNKTLLVYLSMAFGNPYGEIWSESLLLDYISQIKSRDVKIISLADTIGNSTSDSICSIYNNVNKHFPSLDVGLHLHSEPKDTYNKIKAAWDAGCNRFDVAIGGYGGCPFAQNISTEKIFNFLANNNIKHSLDLLAFEYACNQAKDIFQY
jgi:hydroxymethylglutaryl-CoA lyase